MSDCIECFGLEELMKDDVTTTNFFGMIAEKGNAIIGYSGSPYINYHLGDAQMILRTVLDEETHRFTVEGFDTHCRGSAVWKVAIRDINVDFKDDSKTSKRIVVRPLDDNGMAVVNIVNADVLPSYAAEETITLQMIAFAHEINYYDDEDDYSESLKPDELGRRFGIANGSVLPVGLLSPKKAEEKEDVIDITQIRGTIKKLFKGPVAFDDENTFFPFIKGIIDTSFGELEFVHCVYDIPEEKVNKIKVGAIVELYATLSGDAAIYNYENSFIKDEENHLHAYAYALSHGEIDRLKSILSEDFYYYSEGSEKEFFNADDFLEHTKYVHSTGRHCTTWYATVDSVEKDNDKKTRTLYSPGKRCITLFYDDDESYSSLAFIETNNEGFIKQIYLSDGSEYKITLDELPCKDDSEEEFIAPKSIEEAITSRAHFNNLLDNEISEQDLWHNIDNSSDKNIATEKIALIADKLKSHFLENGIDDFFEKVFEYFFIKGLESAFNTDLSYDYEEMCDSELPAFIKKSENDKLKASVKVAKQFYKDFKFIFNTENSNVDDFYNHIIRSLLFVKEIGRTFALKNMQSW